MCSQLCKSTKLCSAFAILLLAAPLFARKQDPAIDAICAPLTDAKSPGVAVLVRQHGHSVFAKGYGVRDVKTNKPIDTRTNFRLASFTKQFTAMAIMLLVHDGKLSYEQNLAAIFPGFPAYGRDITIRHLLTHTSGLMDYEALMEAKEKTQGRTWSPTAQIHDEDVLALLAAQTHGDFAPGTRWSYSNSGYVILGLAVAKVAGMPFPEFLRRRIFAPLKMSHTVAFVAGQNSIRDRAFGYSKNSERFEDTDQSATSATLGDGGIYSNLLDLARWDQALGSAKLLPPAEMEQALQPVKLNDGSVPTDDGKAVSYGFGWFLSPLEGHKRMWHTGSTSGFRSAIERLPDDALTVIVLSNRTDVTTRALAEKIVLSKMQ